MGAIEKNGRDKRLGDPRKSFASAAERVLAWTSPVGSIAGQAIK